MPYVLERDTGGTPLFYSKVSTSESTVWANLANAKNFATEEAAQSVIDASNFDGTVIIAPNDEVLFEGSSEKSNEVLNGMKPDTQGDNAA